MVSFWKTTPNLEILRLCHSLLELRNWGRKVRFRRCGVIELFCDQRVTFVDFIVRGVS